MLWGTVSRFWKFSTVSIEEVSVWCLVPILIVSVHPIFDSFLVGFVGFCTAHHSSTIFVVAILSSGGFVPDYRGSPLDTVYRITGCFFAIVHKWICKFWDYSSVNESFFFAFCITGDFLRLVRFSCVCWGYVSKRERKHQEEGKDIAESRGFHIYICLGVETTDIQRSLRSSRVSVRLAPTSIQTDSTKEKVIIKGKLGIKVILPALWSLLDHKPLRLPLG